MISPTFGEGYTFYEPVKLHPENQHYLWFRGEATLLITSAEHYGAVINGSFDFETYLETLRAEGMNYTRIFVGTYLEKPGAFSIEHNTLAPDESDLVLPWERCSTPGYALGGNKFDLDQWSAQYFDRLHQFIQRAQELWIVVEVTFFTSHFGMWEYSPMHPSNNVNGLPEISLKNVLTLKNGKLFEYQEKLVRRIVRELNQYDNIFYEIQNEPYVEHARFITQKHPQKPEIALVWEEADEDSQKWQRAIASIIIDEESSLPNIHLIAQNFANDYILLNNIDPQISIINLHYAWPEAVIDNYRLNRVVSLDETGFKGNDPEAYRKQAWTFMLSGGGIYNNLDYSFYPGKEDGTGEISAPGSVGSLLRSYLRVLKEFMMKLDFMRMQPDLHMAQEEGQSVFVLAEDQRIYGGYVLQAGTEGLKWYVPDGPYRIQWYDTHTGEMLEMTNLESKEGIIHQDATESRGDQAFIMKYMGDERKREEKK